KTRKSSSSSSSSNNNSSSSKTRISRIKRISSRHKTSSRKRTRAATKTKKNNSKRTSLRRKTNRKRNSSNNPAKARHPSPPHKSGRTIRLCRRRDNDRLNNHQVRAKEKMKNRHLHLEKARRKTPPLPRR